MGEVLQPGAPIGSGTKEQGELLPADFYECVIAEIAVFYRDKGVFGKDGTPIPGQTERTKQAHVALQVSAIDKDGVRFAVTSSPGTSSLGDKTNLAKFFRALKVLDAARAAIKTPDGLTGAYVGKGVKVYIKPSEPKGTEGIEYNNIALDTLTWSDNGVIVDGDFKTQFDLHPSSAYQYIADYEAQKDDDDGLPDGF